MNRPNLHPGMGGPVLDRLAQLHTLPQTGIIAGGAVHAALEALYGCGGAPINDIDVFLRNDAEPILQRTKRYNATVDYDDVCIDYSSYSHMHYLSSDVRYSVKSTERADLLNFIYTNLRYNAPVAYLLQGFDLNYARCGIDLATRELVWLPEFNEFWHNRELRISRLSTPTHTLLRYLKKLAELPDCHGDVEQAKLVAAMPWYDLDLDDMSTQDTAALKQTDEVSTSVAQQMWFGKKFHEMWLDHESELGRAFSLESHAEHEDRLWTFVPRGSLPAELRSCASLLDISACTTALAVLQPRMAYRKFEKKTPSLTALWDKLEELSQRSKTERHFSDRLFYRHLINADYLQETDTVANLQAAFDFLWAKPGFTRALENLPLHQQTQRLEMLHRLSQRFGTWAMVELSNEPPFYEDVTSGNESKLSALLLERLTEMEACNLPDDMRLKLPKELEGYEVEELVRGIDVLTATGACNQSHLHYTWERSQRNRLLRVASKSEPDVFWIVDVRRKDGGDVVLPGDLLTASHFYGVDHAYATQLLRDIVEDALLENTRIGSLAKLRINAKTHGIRRPLKDWAVAQLWSVRKLFAGALTSMASAVYPR